MLQRTEPQRHQGSSPLARGPLTYTWPDFYNGGLIPARAGTTCVHAVSCMFPRAHPRSRGDHPLNRDMVYVTPGSSPLARGPLFFRRVDNLVSGLIPARAGTTVWGGVTIRTIRAHPRSRGDHNHRAGLLFSYWGSSPLARGPLTVASVAEMVFGLIPARAGTTMTGTLAPGSSRAHPRSRGDHLVPVFLPCLLTGSSPLARGPRAFLRAGC